MNDESSEVIVYYQITLAVHVDLAARRVNRVVELREEIHPRDAAPAMIQAGDSLIDCPPGVAATATSIAETKPWPGEWGFGY